MSFRTISTVIIIDRKTSEIIWKRAHRLYPVNTLRRRCQTAIFYFLTTVRIAWIPMPFSRVIEVELATKQIVWKYQERKESDFFSPRVSNAQRLPNGNTLVCEGDFGRLFEVTTDGKLVWEFVNPYFDEDPNGPNNRVFRAYRYSAEIAQAKATTGAL